MYEVVKDDLKPDMELTITVNDISQDISDAESVQLHWIKPDGSNLYSDLEVVDESGVVRRVWQDGDTDTVGFHKGRVVITWSSGETQTFPNDGSWFLWRVNAQLD
jgi:hypothetical protein